MDSVRVLLGGASSGAQGAARSGRGRKPRAQRAASRFVHIFTLMFFLSSLLSPIAAQTAFAQGEVSQENPVVIADTDGDGIEDSQDTTLNGDTDGDGVDNAVDACPAGDDAADADGDGTADACDPTPNGDTDGDGIDNTADATLNGEVPAGDADLTLRVATQEEVVQTAPVTCTEAAAVSPTIVSDLADYPPGALVTLTGTKWVPGQTVDIFVDDDNVADATMGPWSHSKTVVADEFGNIFYQFNLADWFVANYFVTATGECSTAVTAFTDAVNTEIDFHTIPTAKNYGDVSYLVSATSKVKGTATSGTPTGLLVTFTSTTPTVCTVSESTLLADKSSQATVTITGVGTCGVTASQEGGTVNGVDYKKAAAVSKTTAIGKAAQTITFGAQDAKTFGDAAFTVSATATSGETVTFALASDSSGCQLSGATVTITGAGTCKVTGSVVANANYLSASETQEIAIGKAAQTITFGAIDDKKVGDAAFSVSATADSGLTVGFSSQTQSICTVSGSTVTLVAAGTCTVLASQAGNDSYNAAPNETQSFTVAAACANTISEIQAPLGTRTVVKYGSVVPIKIRVTDCNGNGVAGLSPTISVTLASSLTPTESAVEIGSTSGADTGTQLRDLGNGYYMYNLSTKSTAFKDSTATYKVWVTVDGQSKVGELGLKK